MLTRVLRFLRHDLWRLRLGDYRPPKSFLLRTLRVIVLALRGFDEDHCWLRASALTFYSLMSMVPVVAMVFGIAKGFGLDERVQTWIYNHVQGEAQLDVAENVVEYAHALLKSTSGGIITGIGVALLFLAVIKVLANIEKSFNHIWGVKRNRNFARRFSDYLAMIVVSPVLLVVSTGLTSLADKTVRAALDRFPLIQALGPVFDLSLRLVPYPVMWLFFAFVYIFMTNTRVKFSSALLAGTVSGTLFLLVQWVYVGFQVGAAKYGAIYGSLAALPLFLVWVQWSWLVVLFGAELAFAHQNVDTYEFEPLCLNISHAHKRRLTVLMVHDIARRFIAGEPPATAAQLSHELDIPVRLVREILFELTQAHVLTEVATAQEKATAYQPARDVGTLTVESVVEAWENHGTADLPLKDTPAAAQIRESLAAFREAARASDANHPIAEEEPLPSLERDDC